MEKKCVNCTGCQLFKLRKIDESKGCEFYKEKDMSSHKTYPNNEVISKNLITANCYKKIRECFRQHYIEEKFDNPLQPREEEFLQWTKKYLNDMEKLLLKKG